ncbi:unnamed protein product [Aphanomyces euteiches]|uniref:Cysteine dioxygenase n=1 Tax=Aphanomyces euteiches TaxID=100861 RepID=A0A6G0XHB0_9STRA|nr:hypothetical protein Ae201684_004764 [Aphanomyces euteiches]KAH9073117.1 hypothetical protein Ae201684P_014934 [Aphanomyces euteiches]
MITRSTIARDGRMSLQDKPAPPLPSAKIEHGGREHAAPRSLTLQELVDVIETEIHMNDGIPLHKKKDIQGALMAFDANMDDLKRYALFDPTRYYTRNLISTDNASYALMFLCWNKGKYSPIHDHPSDGCWVRHIQGTLNEVRYWNDGAKLVETSNVLITAGVSYMDDSLGLHKIGNPSTDVDAITLHLYAPPYEKCRLWFDPADATKSSTAVANFYSEYGQLN